jgi:hypothetical protein
MDSGKDGSQRISGNAITTFTCYATSRYLQPRKLQL